MLFWFELLNIEVGKIGVNLLIFCERGNTFEICESFVCDLKNNILLVYDTFDQTWLQMY